MAVCCFFFFFSSRRRHTRFSRDWSSDVCSSDLANDSDYGLGAGLFTSNLEHALRFAREVDSGTIQINASPLWRADVMPYGGLKGSGIGKEGARSAVEEMTEVKTI